MAGDDAGPFRADASTNLPWTSLSGANSNGTRPHPDARDMVFDAAGNLLEADDGGIYRLTFPGTSLQAWQSINGNLRVIESSRLAFDPLNDVITSGTQDNGSVEGPLRLEPTTDFAWSLQFLGTRVYSGPEASFASGDGLFQAVDASHANDPNPAQRFTLRYEMQNNFSNFFRRQFDVANRQVDLVTSAHPLHAQLEPAGSGKDYVAAPVLLAARHPPGALPVIRSGLNAADTKHVADGGVSDTPFVLNAIDPRFMLIGLNGLYESNDHGDTIREVTPAEMGKGAPAPLQRVLALAYGGRERQTDGSLRDRPEVAYLAAGLDLFLRESAFGSKSFTPLHKYRAAAQGAEATSIAVDPTNFRTVYVSTPHHVLRGTDVGLKDKEKWEVISNSLENVWQVEQVGLNRLGTVESIELVQLPATATEPSHDVLLAGGRGGVSRLIDPATNRTWTKFGDGLPNVSVTDLHYDDRDPNRADDDILLATTRGRGVWVIPNAREELATPGTLTISGEPSLVTHQTFLTRHPERRGVLEVQFSRLLDAVERREVPLTALQRIVIEGQSGSDIVTIDSTHGVIDVPDGITFTGREGIDALLLFTASGDVVRPLPSESDPTEGDAIIAGSRASQRGGRIHFSGVEQVPPELRLLTEEEMVKAIRNGLSILVDRLLRGTGSRR